MLVLAAEEAAGRWCGSEVLRAFWLGDDGGDALDEETDEWMLLDAIFAWLWVWK